MPELAETQPLRDIDTGRVYPLDALTRPGTSSGAGTAYFTFNNDAVVRNDAFAWIRTTQVIVARRGSGETAFLRNLSDQYALARSPLDEIIEASRAILELELDEDETQTPYAEATWTRAVDFLRRNAKWVSDTLGRAVDLPEILPGPDGSIDLHWDYPGYETLINIPADRNAKAGFYGDDRGEIQIKGSFDPCSHNYGLLLWFAKAK